MADQKTFELLKSYEAPELVELGEAEALTLGSSGCGHDATDCEHAEEARLF